MLWSLRPAPVLPREKRFPLYWKRGGDLIWYNLWGSIFSFLGQGRWMWASWSTPSTERHLFISQAHYWGHHEIQVGFWNVGRSLHGCKWEWAWKKDIGLTRETHTCHSSWRHRVRQEEKKHHSSTQPVASECAVLPSWHEHCACLKAKSETGLERWVLVYLLQSYLLNSHLTSWH